LQENPEMTAVPNLFIVGAPKCGTTSMARYLGAHDSIFMSKPKEPHFFAPDLPREVESMDAYLALFSERAPGTLVVGEASSLYLYSEVAAALIRDFNPDARIVAMIRNPVDLVQSFHSQMVYNLVETQGDFERAWREHGEREDQDPRLKYAAIGRLATQLRRLYAAWPREQVALVRFDVFRGDPRTSYLRVLRHVSVQDDGRTWFPTLNVNRVNRSTLLARLARRTPKAIETGSRWAKKLLGVKEWGIMKKVSAFNTRRGARPPMRPGFRSELSEYFRDEVEALSQLTGEDLTSWVSP
jgi:Sulfotransferase domain